MTGERVADALRVQRRRGLRRLSPVASRLTRLVRRTSVPPRVR